MNRLSLFILSITVPFLCCGCGDKPAKFQKNEPVNFSQVKITDGFWLPRIKTHAAVTLPACIYQSETATNRIANFAIAAGMQEGEFKGFVYDDSDVYKMLEGASYSLMNNPDPVLDAKLDEIIAKIAGAQMDDGYLMTYYILGNINDRWTDMDKHEMYCCGHLIEAGIAHYNATGKRSLLDVAVKFADHIDNTFGEGKREWVPGHQEIELALIKLYRLTGEERYVKLAHWLLEQRGHDIGTWRGGVLTKSYYQDIVPVRDLEKISGHAVRAMYMFTGMADYASIARDSAYIAALDRLWDDVVGTKMYLTGGIGSSRKNEGFTDDYDLPNEEAYCETCASVGMVFWNQRMNMLKGDSRYADVLERSMYNGALAGTALSGDRFFYVNPLASSGVHHRKEWYGTACCPSQISRFLPSIGNYVYATSGDALWVNLFVGSETEVPVAGTNVRVSQETRYPWKGGVKINIDLDKAKEFTLKLRLPGWCKDYVVKLNGEQLSVGMDLGYIAVKRKWEKGDVVEYDMAMPVEVVAADPQVKANVGRRAVQRGPIVYCAEETDNPDWESVALSPAAKFTAVFEKQTLGGVETITAVDGDKTVRFVPYYAWDNREPGKMMVWVPYNE